MDFVHLHLHTRYSIADSTLKEKELVKKIKENGMKAVAITDHGNLFGAINFYKACKAEGIKPIIGMEAYVAPRYNTCVDKSLNDNANYHLVLLAETQEGYQNLICIASDAAVNGFYYKPRTDKHMLRKYHTGIIALSACLGGEIQSLILEDRKADAVKAALEYDSIFGRGNFFLELQNHNTEKQEIPEQIFVNSVLLDISQETGIPLVCTNDCHYLNQDGFDAHDILMAVQAKTTINDTKRKKYNSDQFYVKTPQEMYSIFRAYPEALANTVRIADRCNVSFEFGINKLPTFELPDGFKSNRDFLEYLVIKGCNERYGEINKEINDRINYEISTVERMGYIDYFLIVWDFVRFARDNGILVGPGRGSGAGSIILYSLYVTSIDPIKYNLLFERFLDPSRVSMPDQNWSSSAVMPSVKFCEPYYLGVCLNKVLTVDTLSA